MIVPVFALMNRGLESISAAEIAALSDTRITEIAYRRIEAESSELRPLAELLRTVDDVFIKLATWHDVGHERRWLANFTERSQQLEASNYLPLLRKLRVISHSHTRFSVTVNFVGKRNYSSPEVKTAVAQGIMRRHPQWTYAEDDRDANLNFRVFIEHQTALVGLRIGAYPLHRREYKSHHQPGALKPTVAAAMLQLAGVQPGAQVMDPFCGSGTILIEAALIGARAVGGDIDSKAVKGAWLNCQQADVDATVYYGDAHRVPLANAAVENVVSNMPWDRQVQVEDSLVRLYHRAFAEMQRITRSGGKIVLLTTFPELLGAKPDKSLEISLFGQNPQIVRFTVEN
jgi:23S rRNA G2445 N2-methylase RlmL